MKTLFILTAFILSACSSAKKTADMPAQNTTSHSSEAPAAQAVEMSQKTAKKSTPSAAGLKMIECKNKTETRKLEVVEKNGGCTLDYTKAGATSSVASQIVGTAKCDEVLERIHQKLTSSGYECNG